MDLHSDFSAAVAATDVRLGYRPGTVTDGRPWAHGPRSHYAAGNAALNAGLCNPAPAPEAAERRFELGATGRGGSLGADLVDGQIITKRFVRMAIST